VPVIYARDPNSRLSAERPIDVRRMPSPSLSPSSRRSVEKHEVRIAVWDTHSQFPELRKTLDQMNRVQSYYGFEIVDLSVPLDSWWMKGGKRYLYAERFAERLGPVIPQLNVHYVCAIVDEPLVGDSEPGKKHNYYNLYSWWPSGADEPPVLIFSTSGLNLRPTGPETERAISNVAVSTLAGYLLEKEYGYGAHDAPPQSCPNYENPLRLLKVIAGRLPFCKPCTRRLSARFPRELKAFKALLNANGPRIGESSATRKHGNS
jgi:hypothetical protein